jgi:hypothetical protein
MRGPFPPPAEPWASSLEAGLVIAAILIPLLIWSRYQEW